MLTGGNRKRKEEMRHAVRILLGKPKGNRPLGRPRCRWEDDIKMNVKEIGYEDVEWIRVTQNRDP
jgi:hypothetical protein